MTSRERMLAALGYEEADYIPCSFMLFESLQQKCRTEREFVEKQLQLGLDAYVHVGYLDRSLHPDAKYSEWIEEQDDTKYFCRRIDTPEGPLTGRVRQREAWPREGDFPLFDDLIIPRAEEVLVKPEEDLGKLKYIFGPFKDEDIETLKERSREAKKTADDYGLLQVGGWKGGLETGTSTYPGVCGCDAMAWLSGFESIMLLSITKPELIKEYARIIHEWNMKQIEVYLEVTDAEVILRRGWYETTEFWTPEAYRQIIAPTIKKEAELTHEAGRKYGYIITSAFLPILDHILDAGVDVLIGLDPKQGKGTEFNLVKEKFLSRKKALWGGVSGSVTVELGTKKETEEAVVDALKELDRGGGFVLSPVDNVREDTPRTWGNTKVFIDTWKRYRGQKD